MKFLKFVWRSATRNKLRCLLTIMSIAVSLAMMTVLYGYLEMQDAWTVEAAKHNRVVVMNIQGFSGELPIAYVDQIRRMDGVAAASPFLWYGGIYKDEKMPFAQFGTDPDAIFDVWDEYTIDPEELEAFRNDRLGCVVDHYMAARRGWKVGDRVPLQGNIYPYDLELTIRGIFKGPQPDDSLWFHWAYLDEGLRQSGQPGTGNTGTIFVKATSKDAIPGLCEAIDERFASSMNPTRTQTESAFAQMFTTMMGGIQKYIEFIGMAVIFALSLVAATTMALSLRERTTEIAVLKALGFPEWGVQAIVVSESCLIALAGGLLGVLIGCGVLQALHTMSPQFFRVGLSIIAGPWLANGLVVAAAIGIVSGIAPATWASRLSVVDGLRRVA